MKFDEYDDIHTVDGVSLHELVFAGDWDETRWFRNIEDSHIGGKFNIWMYPTKWPRERWSRSFRDHGNKLIYFKEEYANTKWNKALKVQKTLERMKYYYGH